MYITSYVAAVTAGVAIVAALYDIWVLHNLIAAAAAAV
jgi:hypothetical protein